LNSTEKLEGSWERGKPEGGRGIKVSASKSFGGKEENGREGDRKEDKLGVVKGKVGGLNAV